MDPASSLLIHISFTFYFVGVGNSIISSMFRSQTRASLSVLKVFLRLPPLTRWPKRKRVVLGAPSCLVSIGSKGNGFLFFHYIFWGWMYGLWFCCMWWQTRGYLLLGGGLVENIRRPLHTSTRVKLLFPWLLIQTHHLMLNLLSRAQGYGSGSLWSANTY